MNKFIFIGILWLVPLDFINAASTDYFIKIDGVDGETKASTQTETRLEVQAPGETKGNVEMQWKVEEGEKAEGVEPDEIDVAIEGEATTPDFSILLGGGGGAEGSKGESENRSEVAKIILEGMAETEMPAESMSLNYGRLKAKVVQEVKLLGFIPTSANATVEIDAENQVKVKYPWWAFLATEKKAEELKAKFITTLSNVLKTKSEAIINAEAETEIEIE